MSFFNNSIGLANSNLIPSRLLIIGCFVPCDGYTIGEYNHGYFVYWVALPFSPVANEIGVAIMSFTKSGRIRTPYLKNISFKFKSLGKAKFVPVSLYKLSISMFTASTSHSVFPPFTIN